jgi:hypothetical protein
VYNQHIFNKYVVAPHGGSAIQPNGYTTVLDGSAGDATLYAVIGPRNAVLVGGDGDTLNGQSVGLGIDTFVLMGDFGKNTINNYNNAASLFDVIQLSKADFANLTAVQNAAVDHGSDVWITDPIHSGNVIDLAGVNKASLHFDAAHFLLV